MTLYTYLYIYTYIQHWASSTVAQPEKRKKVFWVLVYNNVTNVSPTKFPLITNNLWNSFLYSVRHSKSLGLKSIIRLFLLYFPLVAVVVFFCSCCCCYRCSRHIFYYYYLFCYKFYSLSLSLLLVLLKLFL